MIYTIKDDSGKQASSIRLEDISAVRHIEFCVFVNLKSGAELRLEFPNVKTAGEQHVKLVNAVVDNETPPKWKSE